MEALFACPFCRQLFRKGEATSCPDCDVRLQPLHELPPSHDVEQLEPPAEPTPPEHEVLAFTYLGRRRGLLVALSLAGIATFFLPWMEEHSPDVYTWSGLEFARKVGWLWAAPVAWFVLVPLVLSRRTIHRMRSARLIVGFLAAVAFATAALRIAFQPHPSPLWPTRIAWGWGLYAAAAVGLAALVAAVGFGGSLGDMPTRQRRRGDETLH